MLKMEKLQENYISLCVDTTKRTHVDLWRINIYTLMACSSIFALNVFHVPNLFNWILNANNSPVFFLLKGLLEMFKHSYGIHFSKSLRWKHQRCQCENSWIFFKNKREKGMKSNILIAFMRWKLNLMLTHLFTHAEVGITKDLIYHFDN